MSTTQNEDVLLDRRLISELSVEVLGPGAKVSLSRIDKLAMRGMGPPVDFLLGPRFLTKRRNAEIWLRSLLRPAERNATP